MMEEVTFRNLEKGTNRLFALEDEGSVAVHSVFCACNIFPPFCFLARLANVIS